MTFKLTVEGFRDGGPVPRRYTCQGDDISPRLSWEEAPLTTQSFVLILDDPDAPAGTWNHWLLWDIPPATSEIAEDFRAGDLGTSGVNDFGRPGYGGPCPPKGHGEHRYYFKLFALDVAVLELPKDARRGQLDRALRGHVLAEARYLGRYERR